MATEIKDVRRSLPTAPWGLLPQRMRVLYVAAPRRTGAWLAEAFAGDSACNVIVEEACGAAAGLERLREQVFDAVLVSHEPAELDAVELVDGLRAGGALEPLIILGQASEQEMSAICYEVGADAYICANSATTRTLLWIVARATERHHLIRENRRMQQAERHRRHQEQSEAQRMLSEQRGLARDAQCNFGESADDGPIDAAGDAILGRCRLDDAASHPTGPSLPEPLVTHYREMLRAHVIMGSGNLSGEMTALAEMLAAEGISAPQTMRLHVQALEELVRGLGNRSARHVMARADLLLVEILVQLAERYRLRTISLAAPVPPPTAPEA